MELEGAAGRGNVASPAFSQAPERTLRILFCGINYAPDLIGVPKYNTELCEWLQSKGHDIHVVTAAPYYPEWMVPKQYRTWRLRSENRNNIPIDRVPIYVPRNPSGPKRLVHHASFALTSAWPVIREVYRWHPQLLMAVAPSLMSCALVASVARWVNAKSWLHLQDFEVDAAFDFGLLRQSSLRKAMLAIERRILRSFDSVSTISPQMLQRLVEKGVDIQNVYELRNWADVDHIVPGPRLTHFREILSLRSTDIVGLYSGTMSNKQGLDVVITAAKQLEQSASHIRFILCGEGPQKSKLQEMAQNLRNIHFIGLQSDQQFGQLLSTADFHILPQRNGAADLVLPSKVGYFLASGRPTIAMAAQGTALASELEGAGIVVGLGNIDEFSRALKNIAESRDLRLTLGARARKYAEWRWNKAVILEGLERQLLTLCHQDIKVAP